MNFELDARHEEVRERARQIAREVVAPRAADETIGGRRETLFAASRRSSETRTPHISRIEHLLL